MQIDLLLTKEEQLNTLHSSADIVVILDILLATSTILECLAAGVEDIYPVASEQEAILKKEKLIKLSIKAEDIFLAGEKNAFTINGFVDPTPLKLKEIIKNKHLILLTTNGTVAIRQAKKAKDILISSLLNGRAIASYLYDNYDSANINIVCAGSNGLFSLEDFYGAGQIIHYLNEKNTIKNLILSDSAIAAKLFYKSNENKSEEILVKSSVGKLLLNLGLESELKSVSMQNRYKLIPYYKNEKISLRKG